MSTRIEHHAKQRTAAVAAITFNSDRDAVDHLVAASRGRRAAPRTIASRVRDVLGALAERRGGRHTREGAGR